MNRFFTLLFLLLFISATLFAQESENQKPITQEEQQEQIKEDQSQEKHTQKITQQPEDQVNNLPADLNTQYRQIKQQAETYGEYKVFKESRLDNFWRVVLDSIKVKDADLQEKQLTINDQLAEIERLNTEFKESESRFQKNEYAATHIEFLGIDFTKSAYTLGMSVLVGGLSLLLLIGYLQYIHNKRVALQHTHECKKLEHDLEELRRKSLEKQVRLNRELQTQRNRLEELKNKATISKKISA